mmetsp:Transcript_4997/g.18215  ORF Transcript_4997/g.18215 Transcript_4997/m.18215 type:complete len:397 (-) Transcript_4997:252-1442(-)
MAAMVRRPARRGLERMRHWPHGRRRRHPPLAAAAGSGRLRARRDAARHPRPRPAARGARQLLPGHAAGQPDLVVPGPQRVAGHAGLFHSGGRGRCRRGAAGRALHPAHPHPQRWRGARPHLALAAGCVRGPDRPGPRALRSPRGGCAAPPARRLAGLARHPAPLARRHGAPARAGGLPRAALAGPGQPAPRPPLRGLDRGPGRARRHQCGRPQPAPAGAPHQGLGGPAAARAARGVAGGARLLRGRGGRRPARLQLGRHRRRDRLRRPEPPVPRDAPLDRLQPRGPAPPHEHRRSLLALQALALSRPLARNVPLPPSQLTRTSIDRAKWLFSTHHGESSCLTPSSSCPLPARPSAACWVISPAWPAGNWAPSPSRRRSSAPACRAMPSTRCCSATA